MNLAVAAACTGAVVLGAGAPANAADGNGPHLTNSAARAADTAAVAAEQDVIPIDLLLAGSYAEPVREAIEIWNKAVPQIKFVEQDSPASLRVKEYTTANGTGSHAYVNGLGKGWVYLETGDAKTYEPTRVATHELGHLLSLPDLGPGSVCSKIMSGAWAGPECTNTQPDAEEIAQVSDFFVRNDLGDPVPGWPDPTD
ncbi:snapalysin family zinc-dependent metalloprotease [Streptomyces sp. Z26]|uniref:snapalysin family zinc-dependent metalloprotease n=1 Tax=Streptomyces TaxID=1883 RepID=UPI001F0C9FBE|nr:snapalysin family zinc-dependent metalloprotease [Streptomyces sp. Z26]